MLPLTLQFIVKSCSGFLAPETQECCIQRVWSDSRTVQAGDLFVALEGANFDSHDFLPEVLSRGATAALVDAGKSSKYPKGLVCVQVPNVRRAYGALAGAYRNRFSLPIIAVAGSNGKTSTKSLIAGVLGTERITLASEGSFNNDVGVPATLLQLDERHQAAVLEVGTNHPGELSPLLGMIRPKYGILTSIGREHLEFFKNIEAVACEEGAIAAVLPKDGVLFINGDIPFLSEISSRTQARIVKVGFGEGNDWRVTHLRQMHQGTAFSVESPEPEYDGEYQTNLIGRHQALNAALALGVGRELGLSRAAMRRGLAESSGAKMRLEIKQANGWTVLNDAYNANADSMIAALETLRDYPCLGRRIAVLGEMCELGDSSKTAHEEVGRFAAETSVDTLLTIGAPGLMISRAARASGLTNVLQVDEIDQVSAKIRPLLRAGDVILFKASRSARLERVVQALFDHSSTPHDLTRPQLATTGST